MKIIGYIVAENSDKTHRLKPKVDIIFSDPIDLEFDIYDTESSICIFEMVAKDNLTSVIYKENSHDIALNLFETKYGNDLRVLFYTRSAIVEID